MIPILLALFPVLLLVATPLAWLDIGLAIVLICTKRVESARRTSPPRVDYDPSV